LSKEITDLKIEATLQETAQIQAKLKQLQAQLEKSYTSQNDHQPHFALLLAFVRLMLLLKEQTNTLTARHLDFYYRQVLQLREKPALPSQVHLLVELQKNIEAHAVAQGVSFKANIKDTKGNDVLFANDRELIANQAKVTDLKTVFLSNEGKLCALPITNSDNGQVPELTTVDGSWQPFFNNNKLVPNAEVGFAIASSYLFLTGGTRTISLNLPTAIASHCKAYLTTEKGWLEKELTASADNTQVQITLNGYDDAIVPYLAKTHGYTFQTTAPVLRVMLKQDTPSSFYHLFTGLNVSNLNVNVSVQNLKNLAVSNDFGPVDISKPFQPFGALPQTGNSLIIGTKELFQKKYTNAAVNVSWRSKPDIDDRISTDLLQNGVWPLQNANIWIPMSFAIGLMAEAQAGEVAIFPVQFFDFLSKESTWTIPPRDGTTTTDFDYSENEDYSTNSKNGFVKFSANTDFGFAQAQKDLIQAIINKENPPSPPVAPTIESLTLTYNAIDTTPEFFHLTPFGHVPAGNGSSLFPVFQTNSIQNRAEFYIGITDLKPPQNLSLLFQVADGTANPRVIKPKPHLQWSYLSGNTWILFENTQVNDLTNGFLQSGIVTLTFPQQNKATIHHTLLPAGKHWVRVSVTETPDAVCKLIRVAAQALSATLIDTPNALNVAAEGVTKLEEPQAAIKKIEQPFASFGGRKAEAVEAFYTRISERLRHRDRAVTLWDYEHLILEAFPQIHQVKCLNHTQYIPNESGTGVYNELAAGHVTIVTIPNQQFQKAIDPLKPYTSLGTLDDIRAFLRKRVSCFVELHIENPDFEVVKTQFKVKFHVGIDDTYHINLLQNAIARYLSPWAYGGPSPTFGGKIYKSALINFIEEQPYVDYITDFKLIDKSGSDQNEITPSKAVSILVSVPAAEHSIEAIPENSTIAVTENCRCHS
jgi:hypothetical protein